MSWTDALGYAFHDLRTYFVRDLVVNWLGGSRWVLRPVRFLIYRAAGIQTQTMNIRPGCRIKFPRLSIGRDTFINDGCAFENWAPIEIGDRCAVGPEVMFCSTSHALGGSSRRGGELLGEAISVGHGCWIGARAVILPGAVIGDGCVVAAGAVVTGRCYPHGLYGGVPAKRLKDLPANAESQGPRL